MSSLAHLLSSRVKAEVFRLLFGPNGEGLHIREIARRAGLNDSTVRQELKRLADLQLVLAVKDGNRTQYRPNLEHPLYPEIRNLVLKTSGLVDVLRDALDESGIRVTFVFGSMADGTHNARSDIDLMLIGDTSLRQVAKLLSGVANQLGREVNPHVMAPAELARRKKAGDHFIKTVLAGPKLFVLGDESELARLGGERRSGTWGSAVAPTRKQFDGVCQFILH